MYTNQVEEPPAKAKWQTNESIYKKNAYIYQRRQEFSPGGAHELYEE
jgi:hypothetical protein